MSDPRKAIFDAVRTARGDRPFTSNDVDRVHACLDGLEVPREASERRRISDKGLRIIKDFEGLSLKAYPDPGSGGDPWTIGYGHTGHGPTGVRPGQIITEAEADALLASDVERFERAVDELAPLTTQGQFDALVSFAFNLGTNALAKSTLLQQHNSGNYSDAQAQFGRWTRAAGRVMPGLVRRRAAEARRYGEIL